MKLALTVWNGRIAPVFDVVAGVRLMEIADRTVQRTETRALEPGPVARRLATLHGWGVQVLICGAVSGPAQALARQYEIELHAFVAGTEQEVLQAWLEHRLDGTHFAMPGCRHGWGHQCRRRRGWRH